MIKKVKLEFNYSKTKFKRCIKSSVDKDCLSRYIKKMCGKRSVFISYNFVSSSEQIKMNNEFKDHNYNTDILTFELSNSDCELTGDVYISLKQIKKNTIKFNTHIEEEINRVLIHGFLHIMGFNDGTVIEKKIMRGEENKYLNYLSKKCSTWNNSVYYY